MKLLMILGVVLINISILLRNIANYLELKNEVESLQEKLYVAKELQLKNNQELCRLATTIKKYEYSQKIVKPMDNEGWDEA